MIISKNIKNGFNLVWNFALFLKRSAFPLISSILPLFFTGCQHESPQTDLKKEALISVPKIPNSVTEEGSVVAVPEKKNAHEATAQIAVRVNKSVITNADIQARCRMLAQFTNRNDPEFMKLIRGQVEKRLIDEALYEQMAEKFKMDLSPAMVDEQFANQAQRFGKTKPEFEALLKKHNIYDTFMASLRAHLIEFYLSMVALPKDLVRVSEKSIDRALKEETKNAKRTRYAVSEIVFVPDAQKPPLEMAQHTYQEIQKIKQQMPIARAFSVLAQQLSRGASAAQGGSLGWLTAEQMPSQMREVVQNLPLGEASRPVAMKNGCYKIFLLNDVKDPHKASRSNTRAKIAVVSVPFKPDFPQDRIDQVNRRVGTILGSKSLKELESIAKEFGYSFRRIERNFGELPDFVQTAPLNKCLKPMFTGESLDICWVIEKKLKEVKEVLPDRKDIQQGLEQEKRSSYASKVFKDFKNRALIQKEIS